LPLSPPSDERYHRRPVGLLATAAHINPSWFLIFQEFASVRAALTGAPYFSPPTLVALFFAIFCRRLLHRNQNRCIFVFEQDYEELGWHRLARVATNCVNIVGAFVKRLSGREGYGLFAVHAHDDAAF
jgi:hypothetical protein